jgi:hypothetical protein
VPGSPPHSGGLQPNAAPTTPRPANLMRERLSSFHQGVKRGKDGSERDGRGPAQDGLGPR